MYLFTRATDRKGEHKATIVKTKKLELVNVCQDRHCPIIFCKSASGVFSSYKRHFCK